MTPHQPSPRPEHRGALSRRDGSTRQGSPRIATRRGGAGRAAQSLRRSPPAWHEVGRLAIARAEPQGRRAKGGDCLPRRAAERRPFGLRTENGIAWPILRARRALIRPAAPHGARNAASIFARRILIAMGGHRSGDAAARRKEPIERMGRRRRPKFTQANASRGGAAGGDPFAAGAADFVARSGRAVLLRAARSSPARPAEGRCPLQPRRFMDLGRRSRREGGSSVSVTRPGWRVGPTAR